MTLDEIRTITTDRPVYHVEFVAALNECLDHIDADIHAGRFEFTPAGMKAGGDYHDELYRIVTTYAPYFAGIITGRQHPEADPASLQLPGEP